MIELDASIHVLSSALFPERLPKINLYLMLCDNLEVWDGVGGGREVQEGWDIRVPMANSVWIYGRTNTIL